MSEFKIIGERTKAVLEAAAADRDAKIKEMVSDVQGKVAAFQADDQSKRGDHETDRDATYGDVAQLRADFQSAADSRHADLLDNSNKGFIDSLAEARAELSAAESTLTVSITSVSSAEQALNKELFDEYGQVENIVAGYETSTLPA